jgi:signal transduction histidine kinase
MISDLLDYVAVSAGQVRLAVETIDPYPVVRAALQEAAAAARDAGVAIEAAFDHESPRILADAIRLQQIIGILLGNSVKFSDPGTVVRLAAQRNGNSFRLVVSDQGRGIDPELLPRIFERFGQQGETVPRSHGGLGLGMPLVKQLTGLHSGTVRAESPGKGLGTTFTLEFPLCGATLSAPDDR